MENASKALFIAASVLIALMIFAFMWYVFGKASFFSETTQEKIKDDIDDFNAQFIGYETSNSCLNSAGKIADQQKASIELNNISDIITVVNLAYDINYKNNNAYKYNQIEVENSVEVIIDGLNKVDSSYAQRYLLEPNSQVQPSCIYPAKKIMNDKKDNINLMNFDKGKDINIYDLIKKMRDSKKVKDDSGTYTIYKYYFTGVCNINEETKKIDSIRFKLVINDPYFDNVNY